MHLVATDIEARYEVVKPFRLPFHSGSMLRGVLGRSLRAAGCARRTATCKADCEAQNQCTYARLFDPPVPNPAPHRFLHGQTRAPQPLIPLFPTPGQIDLEKGRNFSIAVRLLGPLHLGEMEMVLAALEGVSAFELGQDNGGVAFDGATILGRREMPIAMDGDSRGAERVEIVFETPTWLEHDGKLMKTLVFQSFFRAVYRRLTVLCALYGTLDERDDVDFARLDEVAKRIELAEQNIKVLEPWQRRSVARGREHSMQGVLGSVIFVGNELAEFMPTLRLAAKTHIGKSTSFGQGRIRIAVK
jgi:hypothetical protein